MSEYESQRQERPLFEAPDEFRMRVMRSGSALLFLEEQRARVQSERGNKYLQELTWWVTPHGRSGEMDDDDKQLGRAFYDGLVLGTALFQGRPGGYSWAMGDLRTYAPSDGLREEDEAHYKHEVASGILDKGGRGLVQAEAHADLLEDWLMEICPDIRAQSYFEKGFGLMLAIMCDIEAAESERRRLADLEVMAEQLQGMHDFDWDNVQWG